MPNGAHTPARLLRTLALALCLDPAVVGAQHGLPARGGAEVITIFPDSLPDVPRTMSELLESQVPGLLVQRASGAASSGSWLSFRDAVAVRGGEPMLVVDGVALARPATRWKDPFVYRQPSPIDELPVGNVERVDILRGPAAATHYGREARRGVVVITTRREGSGPIAFRASLAGGVLTPRNSFPRNDVAVDANGGICSFASQARGFCTAVGRSTYTPLLAVDPFERGDLREAHLTATGGLRSIGFAFTGSHGRTSGIFPADGEDHSTASAKVSIPYGRIGELRVFSRTALRGATLPHEDFSFVERGLYGLPRDCSPGTPCGLDTVSRGFRGPMPPNELAQLGTYHRDQRFSSGAHFTIMPLPSLTLRTSATHDNAGGRSRRSELQYPGSGIRSNKRAQRTTRVMIGQDVVFVRGLWGLDATTTLAIRSHHERSTSAFHELTTTDQFTGGASGTGRSDERRLMTSIEQRLSAGDRVSGGAMLNRTQTRFHFNDYNPTPALFDGGADLFLRLFETTSRWLRRLDARGAFGVVAGYEPDHEFSNYFEPEMLMFRQGGPPGRRLKPDRTSEWEAGLDAGLGASMRVGVTTFARRETHRTLYHLDPFGRGPAGPLRRRVSGTELAVALLPIDLAALQLRSWASYSILHDHVAESPLGDSPTWGGPSFEYARLSLGRGKSYGVWSAPDHVFQDSDGDGILVGSELQDTPALNVGRSRPSRTALVGTELTFGRSWTLAAAMDYRGGHKVLDRVEVARCRALLCDARHDSSVEAQAYAARPGSVPYFFSGDAVRLRELSLGVAAPRSIRLMGASDMRLTLAARNLATWAKAGRIDPDAALPLPGTRGDAINGIAYSAPRVFTAKVTLRL